VVPSFAAKESASVSENTADDIFKLAKDEHVEFVDVRFCDLPGIMQHFTIPISFFD
jgi:glutamine synthetase